MPAEREAGFTLVEVLVALVMAGLLTAILLNGAATARERSAHATDMQKAVFLARTLLTHAVIAPFGTHPKSGTTNGFAWTLDEHLIRTDPRGLYGLVELHAAVSNARQAMLFKGSTRRLKAMPRR